MDAVAGELLGKGRAPILRTGGTLRAPRGSSEAAFPGKLWLCSKWEQVKLLSGDCVVPSGLSSISYGIPEFSADAAVERAIEALWDTAHYAKKLTVHDVFEVTDEFLREHAAAINTAKAARMAVLDGGLPPGGVTEVVPENPAVGGAPTGGAPVGNGPVPPAFDGSLGITDVDDRRDLFPDGGRGGLSSPADDLNHFAVDDNHGRDDGDSIPPALGFTTLF